MRPLIKQKQKARADHHTKETFILKLELKIKMIFSRSKQRIFILYKEVEPMLCLLAFSKASQTFLSW